MSEGKEDILLPENSAPIQNKSPESIGILIGNGALSMPGQKQPAYCAARSTKVGSQQPALCP